MVIVFVALVLAVMVTANWYVWRRLFRDTTSGPGWPRRAGAALIAGGWLMAFGALVAERTGAPFWLQQTLAWPGFLWLALSMYLLLGLLVGEVLRPLLRRWLERRKPAEVPVRRTEPVPVGAPTPPEPEGPALLAAPSRRLFVSRVIGGAAAAAAVGTVGVGTYGVLKGPSVKRVTVPLAKLPRGAHGYRIAVVSDIHLGPVLGRGFAQRVVDTINSTQPDLVAVVGDLVDGSVKDLRPAAAPLTQLKAPAYFVTGNHEYFSGAEQWVEEVRRLGLLPLENARAELPWFDLAGVNDIAGEDEGQGPDFAKALGDRDPARACVLLAHQPVQIHDAVEHGVDLQLSGHTHGGQLWPGNLIAAGANPTLAGLERYGDTQLYVSRGAGAWGPPTRVGAPSDITVIELASKQA
ncbi:metallophosphoesterase [Streptomyces cinnabarinus]|uniref:Metallophosphoesterase n=1 Tax=Streptomyces cinnabarinus TaxID=67287 RepID=A0ABY7KGJ0_9ACTN|nr:metallophosphoesterase [Streptomyces cinnabarinus]WAZ23656.1 metallophosphoesterase [Streptomyces cinnabarinus]